jgi:hypothetical protein
MPCRRGRRSKIRIAYAVPAERFTVFLPTHKSIPDDSCVHPALETGEVETAEESRGVSELPPCRMEVMSMPPGDDAEASLRAVALSQSSRAISDAPLKKEHCTDDTNEPSPGAKRMCNRFRVQTPAHAIVRRTLRRPRSVARDWVAAMANAATRSPTLRTIICEIVARCAVVSGMRPAMLDDAGTYGLSGSSGAMRPLRS